MQKDHHRRVPRKVEDIERAQEFGLHEIHLTEMARSPRGQGYDAGVTAGSGSFDPAPDPYEIVIWTCSKVSRANALAVAP